MKTIVSASLAGAVFVAATGRTLAADAPVPTYSAVYTVEYKGRGVGTAAFSVTYDAAKNVYEFTSKTMAKGLLKLARPNAVVERSDFLYVNGHIKPVEFWYEDGSRKGDDNKHLEFDWGKHVAVISDKDGRREIALQDMSLDTGSLQVALMQDLITTGHAGKYVLANDGADVYEYVDKGEAMTMTWLGLIATHSFVRQREGSTRSSWIWAAPSLRWLPVRIETRKDDEVQTSFTLMSVEGLEKQ
jgi:hypothetical protein